VNPKLAFIGGGVMAGAILRGIVGREGFDPSRISVSEPVAERRAALATLNVCVCAATPEAVAGAELVVLAVKPDVVPAVAAELAGCLEPGACVVSIAAGVSIQALEGALPAGTPVVRAMPNTPLLVGEGATVLAAGASAGDVHLRLARSLFEPAGLCLQLPEKTLDAVTGLSGSGPAYVCVVIEALADGGVRAGLPRDAAIALAVQTVLGAAKLVRETGDHPAAWKDRVATPGGTTIAGLLALERRGLRAALIEAVDAAARRAAELSGKG
jgi:pyrroline-5-carboxylate reductase